MSTLRTLPNRILQFLVVYQNDALNMLLSAQFLYLVVGTWFLDFNISWVDIGVAVVTALVTELAFANKHLLFDPAEKPKLFFPKSALAAAFGIGLFFRALNPCYFALAAFLAIASKYVLRVNGKHIFNPSNIAILLLVFLAPNATTIEYTQWGHDLYIYVGVAVISLFISYRAKTMPTTLAFLGSYTLLLIGALWISPERFVPHHYGLLGPTLMVFASLMITDPKILPVGFWPRILHGISISFLYFFYEALGVRYALFLAGASTWFLNALLKYPLTRLVHHVPSASFLLKIGTLVFACILCVCGCIYFFRVHHPRFEIFPVSLQFILFGIESNSVRACTSNPIFVQKMSSGLESKAVTNGASWGDYDNDGYDDIFVSNADQPSRLYHNNHDGTFTDVTKPAGIPEIRASSAAFVDYDNSGTLSLFVSEFVYHSSDVLVRMRVFKPNPRGIFVEITKNLGLSDTLLQNGAARLSFADYDRNGKIDFIVATNGRLLSSDQMLLLPFRKSRLDQFFNQRVSHWACGYATVSNILDRNPWLFSKSELSTIHSQLHEDENSCLVFPTSLDLLADVSSDLLPFQNKIIDARFNRPGKVYLFENYGGRFSENMEFTKYVDAIQGQASSSIAAINAHPFSLVSGRYFQPLSVDYNNDGFPDIFLPTDFGRNVLLQNLGGSHFKDITAASNMDYLGNGMGADAADLDNNGTEEILSTNAFDSYLYTRDNDRSNPLTNSVFKQRGIGWGVSFLDYNLDGWDDIFVTHGISEPYRGSDADPPASRAVFRTNSVYLNERGVDFKNMTGVDICPVVANGYPLAVSDYDNDGDPDVFVGTLGTGNYLYENTISHANKHFIEIALIGNGKSDTSMGVGVAVTVSSDGEAQTKTLKIGEGFGSQNSTRLLFGLGDRVAPVEIHIRWLSGKETFLKNIPIDQQIVVREK